MTCSYDADDSANHAPAPAAAAAPPAANQPPPASGVEEQPSAPTITPSIENTQIEQFDSNTAQQSMENGNPQNGGESWNNAQGNNDGSMDVKHEAQGTGIKEDG
jgi:hypothetical protein